jgi:SAM-dependent methyltransferase
MEIEIPAEWLADPYSKKSIQGSYMPDEWMRKHIKIHKDDPEDKDQWYEYYHFIPEGIEEEKDENNILDTWEHLQANGIVSYTEDPENNLGVGDRNDSKQFAEFCQFKGKILDVGVGPQGCPSHIQYWRNTKSYNCEETFFIGLDPLLGEFPKGFGFVHGLAEYLPFVDGLFDQVLFVTSLDHVFNPHKALQEAKRVLRDDGKGEIIIWNTTKLPNAPKPKKTNAWYEELEIPEGAEDRFHFKKYVPGDMERLIQECGLDLEQVKMIQKSEYKIEVFYKCRLKEIG